MVTELQDTLGGIGSTASWEMGLYSEVCELTSG